MGGKQLYSTIHKGLHTEMPLQMLPKAAAEGGTGRKANTRREHYLTDLVVAPMRSACSLPGGNPEAHTVPPLASCVIRGPVVS